MKKFMREFREFAFKGSAVDLAVGIIIGTAFTAIVNSIVKDLFMPVVKLIYSYIVGLAGYADPEHLLKAQGATLNKYLPDFNPGSFASAVIQFMIIALCLFLIIKAINRLHKKEEAKPAPAAPSNTEVLLSEIRDLLREEKGAGHDEK
ncbi:MAG: large conductance mechanosensitive channel protein MscL [Clostridia bacterium]|nr:large conductance mechanosensitive channel protein MscL [Clostridia bacterium]MDR3645871.1 large conductance mechanosensitive channel protein MscL [Clostridia bacterium]